LNSDRKHVHPNLKHISDGSALRK